MEPDASGWVDVGSEQADLQWHELRKSKINFLTFSGYLTWGICSDNEIIDISQLNQYFLGQGQGMYLYVIIKVSVGLILQDC